MPLSLCMYNVYVSESVAVAVSVFVAVAVAVSLAVAVSFAVVSAYFVNVICLSGPPVKDFLSSRLPHRQFDWGRERERVRNILCTLAQSGAHLESPPPSVIPESADRLSYLPEPA